MACNNNLPYQTLLACPRSETSQCIADYLSTPMSSPTMAMAMMGERFPHALRSKPVPQPVVTPQMVTVPAAAPQNFTAFRPQRFFKLS